MVEMGESAVVGTEIMDPNLPSDLDFKAEDSTKDHIEFIGKPAK